MFMRILFEIVCSPHCHVFFVFLAPSHLLRLLRRLLRHHQHNIINTTSSTHHQHNTINAKPSTHHHQHAINTMNTTQSTHLHTINTTQSTQHHLHDTINTTPPTHLHTKTQHHQHNMRNTTPSTQRHLHDTINTTPSTHHHQHIIIMIIIIIIILTIIIINTINTTPTYLHTINTTPSTQHHEHHTINTTSSTRHHQHNAINTTPSPQHHQDNTINTTPSTQHDTIYTAWQVQHLEHLSDISRGRSSTRSTSGEVRGSPATIEYYGRRLILRGTGQAKLFMYCGAHTRHATCVVMKPWHAKSLQSCCKRLLFIVLLLSLFGVSEAAGPVVALSASILPACLPLLWLVSMMPHPRRRRRIASPLAGHARHIFNLGGLPQAVVRNISDFMPYSLLAQVQNEALEVRDRSIPLVDPLHFMASRSQAQSFRSGIGKLLPNARKHYISLCQLQQQVGLPEYPTEIIGKFLGLHHADRKWVDTAVSLWHQKRQAGWFCTVGAWGAGC